MFTATRVTSDAADLPGNNPETKKQGSSVSKSSSQPAPSSLKGLQVLSYTRKGNVFTRWFKPKSEAPVSLKGNDSKAPNLCRMERHYQAELSSQRSLIEAAIEKIGLKDSAPKGEVVDTILLYIHDGGDRNKRNAEKALKRHIDGEAFATKHPEERKRAFAAFCQAIDYAGEYHESMSEKGVFNKRVHNMRHAMVDELCSERYFPRRRGEGLSPKFGLLEAARKNRQERLADETPLFSRPLPNEEPPPYTETPSKGEVYLSAPSYPPELLLPPSYEGPPLSTTSDSTLVEVDNT